MAEQERIEKSERTERTERATPVNRGDPFYNVALPVVEELTRQNKAIAELQIRLATQEQLYASLRLENQRLEQALQMQTAQARQDVQARDLQLQQLLREAQRQPLPAELMPQIVA